MPRKELRVTDGVCKLDVPKRDNTKLQRPVISHSGHPFSVKYVIKQGLEVNKIFSRIFTIID